MVAAETKGLLELITIDGDNAKIETIKDRFEGRVSLAQVGDTISVLDTPLKYLLGPEAKKKIPRHSRRRRSKRPAVVSNRYSRRRLSRPSPEANGGGGSSSVKTGLSRTTSVNRPLSGNPDKDFDGHRRKCGKTYGI
jgi:hypothetical protein